MIVLTKMERKDVVAIKHWPQYQGVQAQMDYALRDNGWLDAYCGETNNYCYAANAGNECVGFSMLIGKSHCEAEFRVAIHPDYLGNGYGNDIIRQTLNIGFVVHELDTISLIVRKNNPVAFRLYEKHGFFSTGETREVIQGRKLAFHVMRITRTNYKKEQNDDNRPGFN